MMIIGCVAPAGAKLVANVRCVNTLSRVSVVRVCVCASAWVRAGDGGEVAGATLNII